MTAIVTEAVTGKLRPDAAAKARRFGGRTGYLWNLFTAMNNTRMRERGKLVFYAEPSAMLPRLPQDDRKLAGLAHRCADRKSVV